MVSPLAFVESDGIGNYLCHPKAFQRNKYKQGRNKAVLVISAKISKLKLTKLAKLKCHLLPSLLTTSRENVKRGNMCQKDPDYVCGKILLLPAKGPLLLEK